MLNVLDSLRKVDDHISLEEAVRIASEDASFYGEFFFPKTCRQNSPLFHKEMWNELLNPNNRFVAFEIFRGGAKTSIVRLFLSYCIAFGISRTIIVVGKSQDSAVKTVEWLMRAVEFNRLWSTAFGLRKGAKWSGTECDIWHGTEEVPIRVIAFGITGSIRGVNVDDYRPDLIVGDDLCDEENTATAEQRKKTSDLWFGALGKSLAPESEAPLAKQILLQTVLNEGDLISLCCKDPQWQSLVFSCFDAVGESRWPARWTTKALLDDKAAHFNRGMMSLWLREMECKLVSDETAAFNRDRLQYWDILPEDGHTWLAIDPTPPPKEGDRSKVTKNLDDAAILVLRLRRGRVYVCETYTTKSPDPYEFVNKMFELCINWKCLEIHIETILFARVMASILEKEQQKNRMWLKIVKVEDRRKKETLIRQELSGIISSGNLFLHRSQTALIEQLINYPDVNHDDLINALAIGLMGVRPWMLADEESIEGEFTEVDKEDKKLVWRGRAP